MCMIPRITQISKKKGFEDFAERKGTTRCLLGEKKIPIKERKSYLQRKIGVSLQPLWRKVKDLLNIKARKRDAEL